MVLAVTRGLSLAVPVLSLLQSHGAKPLYRKWAGRVWGSPCHAGHPWAASLWILPTLPLGGIFHSQPQNRSEGARSSWLEQV